ncbi:MAG TPA: sugar ABC transporter permease [Solirubrobacteraceae bacterium]|jgi:ABC-type sugar transport system permease subunit
MSTAAVRLGRQRSRSRSERHTAWAMVAPTVVIVLAVAFLPVLETMWLSLHHSTASSSLSNPGGFAGLRNFSALFSDPVFAQSLKYTAIFTVVAVPIELVIGMGVALILHRRFRGRGFMRAIVLIPWGFPLAIAAVLARLMLQSPFGILGFLLQQVGLISSSSSVLSNNTDLLIGVIVVDVWTSVPFIALLLLAGLQTIPNDVLAAAKVDGATPVQSFFRVTLPLLKPALLVSLLFRTLQAWAVYDLFYVMAENNIKSLSTYVYQGVINGDVLSFPPATAAAVFTFATSLAIALVYIKGFGVRTVQDA